MIYMFILIRMGKDRIDRGKDWILCNVFIKLTQYGVSEEKNGSIFSSWLLLKDSPPCLNKVTYIETGYTYKTVPFTSQV